MIVATPQNEFWYHVSAQAEIPIAGACDKSIDVPKLLSLIKEFPSTYEHQRHYLKFQIKSDPGLIDILRPLVGVSDKRMYLELSHIFSKTKFAPADGTNILGYGLFDVRKHPLPYFKSLLHSSDVRLADKSLETILLFLEERKLLAVLEAFRLLSVKQLTSIVDTLILTKEVQQAEAKRRGHGAEFALAVFLHRLGCKMHPERRWQNPMGFQDPNVDRVSFQIAKKQKGHTWSLDLILTGETTNVAFVQSLIHTSDPGQYGVNKSDETLRIRRDLDEHNRLNGTAKELWGLVDGVGFCENKRDTLDKMLTAFDCFIQLKTLYKAGLRLHHLGLVRIKAIRFHPQFYTADLAHKMYNKYARSDILFSRGTGPMPGTEIPAGTASLSI